MRRTREDAETTRLSLLRAAGKVFSERGFAATRLSEIAKEANVTRGAIYWHFGNKKRLFNELIREKITPFFELIDGVISEDLGPIEKLRAVMVKTASNFESDNDFKTSQQLEFIVTGMMGRDNSIKKYLDREAARLKSAFTLVVEEGQARGEIDDRFDANDIISHLVIFLRGITFMLMKNEGLFKINERIEQMVDLEISAIQKK